MSTDEVRESITTFFQENLDSFLKFAAMRNLSPVYDANWESKGDLLNCFTEMKKYIEEKNIKNIKDLEILQQSGKTPALTFYVDPSDSSETYTTLIYSHIDKIPFGDGWTKIDPEVPKMIDGYIYGRGVATGLYSIFTIMSILEAMQNLNMKTPKIIVLLESSFESGSSDLTTHLQTIKNNNTNINNIICLETWAPCNNFFHYTKSTRGLISFDLKITTATRAAHSGSFGGLIPDPMMIFQNIMENKIEKIEKSGNVTNILIPDMEVTITDEQEKECKTICDNCGYEIITLIPNGTYSTLIGNKGEDEDEDFLISYKNGVLRPSCTILGFENMPDINNASGTLKPYINVRLCFRTPPSFDVNTGFTNLETKLKENVPFNAIVEIENVELIQGIDLDNTNTMSENMLNSIDGFTKELTNYNIQAFRICDSLLCLNYLTGMFKDAPVLVTGGGENYTGNTRGGNECLRMVRIINFSTCLACFISDFENYKS